jgi:hypothetical protein
MKRAFIIVLFFIQQVFTLTTNAQTTVPTTERKEKQSKIELKPYFSNVTSKAVSQFDGLEIKEYYYNKRPQYGIETLYKINKIWSVGLNLGYSARTLSNNSLQSLESGGYTLEVKSIGESIFYGIKSELQLLPLIIKDKKFRLNVYLPMQVGLVSQQITTFATNSKSWDKPAYEIGAGLGISYKIIKNIGIFGEYQVGQFYNNRNSQWKAGVLVTF